MDRKMTIAAVIVVIVVIIAAAAVVMMGGDDKTDDDREFTPVTVTDGIGREVTIDSVDRITSCSSFPTALICGLGMSSHLVAVSSDEGVYDVEAEIIGVSSDDYPRSVIDGLNDGTIKGLGPMYNMSAETVVSVDTDLVVFGEFGFSAATGEALDKLGVTYIVLANDNSFDIVIENIMLLGKALDRQDEATELANEMSSTVDTITEWCQNIVKTELGGDAPDVCVMMTSTYAVGDGYINGIMINEVGGDNVFGDLGMYAVVSAEAIAQANPEYIIYTNLTMGSDMDVDAYIQGIMSDPVLGSIDACINGNVYAVKGSAENAISYTDQGIVNAYALYAMFLYGKYLPFDVPNIIGDEYMTYVNQFWKYISS